MSETSRAPTLRELALCFLQIGLASFGGGLSAWTHRIIVERRRWMTEEQFLGGLTLARLFPGPNQVNVAVFIGHRFHGVPGAAAALTGLLGVPFAIHLALGYAYFRYHHVPSLAAVLSGAAAAAAGMSVSMGLKIAMHHVRHLDVILIAAVTFVAVAVLRWPLLPVVLVLAPFSIAWSWSRMRAEPDA